MRGSAYFIAAFLCVAACAHAQVTTGAIAGRVLDPSGAPVRDAEIRVLDKARALVRRVFTDGQGRFTAGQLAPSEYRVSASASQFETAAADIEVPVNTTVPLAFRLALEPRRERVEVRGSSRVLGPRTPPGAPSVGRAELDNLPLNRRDFLQFALLTPGVSPAVEDSELSQRGSFAMHAGGGREEFNNYLVDGVDNNDADLNRYVLQPPVEAIQEFQIEVNSYSAEFGRSGAGQVNVVTQRGGNQYHGLLYEYLRNRAFDARNFFDGPESAKYNRHQAGFAAGGPVVRNHLFFFTNAEALSERRGLPRLATVPGLSERAGDFSETGQAIFDPFTRSPFPQARIPATRIDPTGARTAALFPLPDLPGRSGNYLAEPVYRGANTIGNARLDFTPRETDSLSFRYTRGVSDLFEPFAEDPAAIPGFGDLVHDPGWNLMAHYQRIVSPSVVNSARFGWSRFERSIEGENAGVDAGAVLGAAWLDPTRDKGFPAFNVAGYPRVGDITSLPIARTGRVVHGVETLSVARGRHYARFGGELRRTEHAGNLDLLTRGSLSFSGTLSGNGLADLLLGLPSFALRAQSDKPEWLRSTAYSVFIQDDWRATPKATLSLGIRYEFQTPPADPRHRMYSLDLNSRQVVQVGTGTVPSAGIRAQPFHFAPRLGAAWSPTDGLRLRAGYGVYFDSGLLMVSTAQYYNPPLFELRVYFPTASQLLTLSNPFPATGGMVPPASLNVLDPSFSSAYLQHWNLSLERAVPKLGTVALTYAGSKGTHLVRSRDINQPPPAPQDLQSRRPEQAFGNILFIESGGNSVYHSLQASWNKQAGTMFSFWAFYTFSKSIDDTSAFLPNRADQNFPQDSRNFRLERGLSSFDVPHRFVASAIWTLPKRPILTRNTELSGIAVVQAGQPFTPRLRFDNSNTGNTGGNFGSDRPDLLGDPRLAEPTPERWFDTEAFAVPAPYTFGSAGRNIVRGPGLATIDLGLARRFPFNEKTYLQLCAQAFNVLNRTNLNLPELYADDPANFGRIFSAKPARQIQFALRWHF